MKKSLWNNIEVISTVDGVTQGLDSWDATGVSIDSRNTVKGDIFIALKGNNHDGHRYVNDAFKNGAIAAIIQDTPNQINKNKAYIKVDNTYQALDNLAVLGRNRNDCKLLGITGSVGKTTTKDYLYAILNEHSNCHANKFNYNNRIGVPLSLAQIPRDCDFVVQEMGMSNFNEILKLSEIAKPNLALITAIGGSHLENFQSLKDIAIAKSEIFKHMTKDGIAILPSDSKFKEILISEAKNSGIHKILFFGENKNSEARLISINSNSSYIDITADIMGENIEFKISGHLPHNSQNAIAAILAAKTLGIENSNFYSCISKVPLLEGRGQIQRINLKNNKHFSVIDDCYNASSESMISSIQSLTFFTNHNPVLVLGDILELGNFSETEHEKLIPFIEKSNPRLFISIGKEMLKISKKLNLNCNRIHFPNSLLASKKIPSLIQYKDIVLIKGSNGLNLKKIVSNLRKTKSTNIEASYAA